MRRMGGKEIRLLEPQMMCVQHHMELFGDLWGEMLGILKRGVRAKYSASDMLGP